MSVFTSNIPMIIKNTSTMKDISAQNIDLSGNLFVSGSSKFSKSLDVSGNVNVDGTLDVSGHVTMGSDLDVSGNITNDGTLDVSGIVTLRSNLDISGDVTITGESLDLSGDVTMGSNLDISGNVNMDGTLDVSGNVTLGSDLDFSGNVSIDGTFDVSGTTTLHDISCNGSMTIVGNDSDDPIMTIRKNDDGVIFDTIVIRRVSDNDTMNLRELQLWVNDVNILPTSTNVSNDISNQPLGNTTEFFNNFNGLTEESIDNIRTADHIHNGLPSVENDDLAVSLDLGPASNSSLYIPMDISLNTNDIQSLVLYNRVAPVLLDTDRAIGLRIELYNRDNDPSLFNPLAFTNTITSGVNVYRFDFPSLDTYPDASFVTTESPNNITSSALISDQISYTRPGLRIENAGLRVDGNILSKSLSVIDSESTDTIVTIRNIGTSTRTGLKIENSILEVDGQGIFNGNVQYVSLTQTSDDRLKKDEQYISNATQTITKLRPQTYKKYEYMNYSGDYIVESGLIAQEIYYDVHELRHLVYKDADISGHIDSSDDPTIDPDYSSWGSNPASVNYIGLISYLIRAIQEQQEIIEKNKNDLLSRIRELEKLLKAEETTTETSTEEPTTEATTEEPTNEATTEETTTEATTEEKSTEATFTEEPATEAIFTEEPATEATFTEEPATEATTTEKNTTS